MKTLLAGAALAVMTFAASAASASVTVYTNQALFLLAAGPVTTEDFSDNTLAAGLGITSTAPQAAITGGHYHDRPVFGVYSTTFSFTNPTFAFGGFWDETPGGFGQNLALTLQPSNLSGGTLAGYSGGFYGLVSTTSFSSVLVTAACAGCGVAETYDVDNIQFGRGAAVPEPATWAMMLVGFGGLGSMLRRRRAVALAA